MNNCGNCKHWDTVPYADGVGVRICRNVPMFWNALGRDECSIAENYKDKLAFAQDGNDYCARLLTMKDFGCVAFEPKEKA